jgi:VanZ family protein
MKKILMHWLPVVIWAGMIFYTSSQPYEKQDLRPTISENIDLKFVKTLFSSVDFNYAGEEVSVEKLGTARFIEFFIRKAAHLFAYFGLGFLTYRAINLSLNSRLIFFYSWTSIILYAISDEIHQSLTPNRSPHIEDVMIDTVGGLVGITLALFFYKNIRRKRI